MLLLSLTPEEYPLRCDPRCEEEEAEEEEALDGCGLGCGAAL